MFKYYRKEEMSQLTTVVIFPGQSFIPSGFVKHINQKTEFSLIDLIVTAVTDLEAEGNKHTTTTTTTTTKTVILHSFSLRVFHVSSMPSQLFDYFLQRALQ